MKDGRRIEQVQEMMDGFEIGGNSKQIYNNEIDLEWDGFEVKRDKMGEYIEARFVLNLFFIIVLLCPLSLQRR